ncbi:MAG TPA: TlpA disulfide reductase family protein, partial [Parasegetibacter sp.]
LSLANGVAKDVRIYGSRAQTDIEKWKQENYNFLKSVIDLRSELGRLIKQPPKMEAGSVKALQDSARLRLQLTYDKIGRSVFQLVESNPASYAGAYLLHWYKTNVPLDSLKKYYLKLSPSVQQAEFSVSLFDYLFTLSNDEFRAGNGNKLSRDLNKARSLYDFTIKDQNEENIKLSQFKGKPVLLFFWATWCSSCHQYERYLNDLMESLESDSIHFISVSLDKIDDFQKSNKKIRLPCITLLDSENTLRYFYRFLYVPTFIILDHKGGIVFNNSSISSLKDSIYQALERYHEDVQIKAK